MSNAVIGALRVNLGLDSAAFSDGLKKAQGGLSKFGSAMKSGLVAVAAAGAAAVTAMGMSVRQTIDAADEMSKAAQKIGIPTEELSRLKYAADLSGVSFGSLQTGVRTLSKAMANLTDSNSPAVAALEQMGINARDAAGNMRPTSDVMMEMADVFARMPDGAEKTATAVALFGKAGADMIPMLNGGSEALRGLMAEADQFGQVFTTEMGQQAEVFNDNISRLQGAFGNIAAQIAKELLPYLAQFTDWMVANAPQIAGVVVKFVEFGAAVVQLGQEVAGFVTGAWAQFAAAWDGMVAKVDAVKARIEQFTRDFVAAFQALPAQMLAIGTQIIDGLWAGIQSRWEGVKAGIGDLASGIAGRFRSVLGIQSPSKVMHGIGVNVMQGLGDGMASMEQGVMSIGESIASSLTSAFMGIVDGSKKVKDVLKDLLKQITSMVLSKAFSALFGGLFGGGGGFLGRLFGGFRASGGPVTAGRAYVVGERGPELMVPNASGTIVPNHALNDNRGGGSVDVRVAMDRNGNLQAYVERTSGRVSAQVVRAAAPGIVESSTLATQQAARARPGFFR